MTPILFLRLRTTLAVVALASAIAAGARADGGSYERPDAPPYQPRKEVIVTVPTLDHHYRDDMVEEGWRMYGAHGGFDPRYNSLDRQRPDACDPWKNACRPAEPWWTR